MDARGGKADTRSPGAKRPGPAFGVGHNFVGLR
jgi:hypothetical protein